MYPDVLLFIDGEWTKAASGRTIPVENPATDEVVGTVAHADKGDLDRALEAAEKGEYDSVPVIVRNYGIESGKVWQEVRDSMPNDLVD